MEYLSPPSGSESHYTNTADCTSCGLLQLVLQIDVLLFQEADLTGQLADGVQALDVDVGRSTYETEEFNSQLIML